MNMPKSGVEEKRTADAEKMRNEATKRVNEIRHQLEDLFETFLEATQEESRILQQENHENLTRKADKQEEERLIQLEKLSAKDMEILKAEQQREDARIREQVEQERRDHELALRLANECNSQVEDFSSSNKLYSNQNPSNKKYDLSKWKYSELRDTINNSCDIELLEACRHEFHKRFKVYHAWKAKKNKKTSSEQNERAPKAIMDAANRASRTNNVTDALNGKNSQRYFRIPFVRPSLKNSNEENGIHPSRANGRKGWWYAHFDGQYVARQMELHPDKPAILLVAGVDDMEMCDLSLEETGLARKRGVEILEHEFDKEWLRNGGKPYVRPSDRVK